MKLFEIEIPVPASKKNRQRIIRVKGRPRIIMSKKAEDLEGVIGLLVDQKLAELRKTGPLFHDDDVMVDIDYFPRKEVCRVTVRSLNPRPKRFTGRKRDIANLPESILDAFQGRVYGNDNQVAWLTVRRLLLDG